MEIYTHINQVSMFVFSRSRKQLHVNCNPFLCRSSLGQESANTKKKPKDMIKEYGLKKAKLAFSIVQLDPLNGDSYQCTEPVFSDVMEEIKTSQKTSDAASKPAIQPRAQKRRCSNANDRISTSESENEEDACTGKGLKTHLNWLSGWNRSQL